MRPECTAFLRLVCAASGNKDGLSGGSEWLKESSEIRRPEILPALRHFLTDIFAHIGQHQMVSSIHSIVTVCAYTAKLVSEG